jgi:nicotinamide-nucleotide amidase
MEAMMRRPASEIPANFLQQTYQPQGAEMIPNPRGTAPGIDLTVKRADVFPGEPIPEGRLDFIRMLAFPGVPAEMIEMWNDSGRQRVHTMLDELLGVTRIIKVRTLHAFGQGESAVGNMLGDILHRDAIPQVGITATQGTINLRIVAKAETEEECDRLIESVANRIYEILGNLVFGEGVDTLGDVACRIAKSQGKTIAVIEAGTRGLLSEALGRSAESAGVFLGGIVVPPRTPIAPDRMIEIGHKSMFDADYFLLVGAYPEGLPYRTRGDETFVAVIDAREPDLQASILRMQNFAFNNHPGIIDDMDVKRALNAFRLLFR